MAISEAERKARKNARTRADRAANPEKYRSKDRARSKQRAHQQSIAHKARYDANPEKYRARTRAFNAANPEKKRARDKAYYDWLYETKGDAVRAAGRAKYAANPDGQKVRGKRYALTHPEVYRRAALKYRARKLEATVGDTNLITAWEATWKSKRTVSCYWCRKRIKTSTVHVDHVVPLSKGGEHSVNNLCVSCEKCNLTKQAKLPEDFAKTVKQPPLFVRMD